MDGYRYAALMLFQMGLGYPSEAVPTCFVPPAMVVALPERSMCAAPSKAYSRTFNHLGLRQR